MIFFSVVSCSGETRAKFTKRGGPILISDVEIQVQFLTYQIVNREIKHVCSVVQGELAVFVNGAARRSV